MKNTCAALTAGVMGCAIAVGAPAADQTDSLLGIMAEELDYSMQRLVSEGTKPYYLAYAITDTESSSIVAQLGALYQDNQNRQRVLDVDVRVGDYKLDNTHEIRGGAGAGFAGRFGRGSASVSLDDSPQAIRHALWRATDSEFRAAVARYDQVLTNQRTMVDEEPVDDFTREEPSTYSEANLALALDRELWKRRVRSVSEMTLSYPLIYESQVSVAGSVENRSLVTSEGTRVKTARKLLRVVVSASTKAEDGMDLSQSFIFNASSEAGLPDEAAIRTAFKGVIDRVLALREAPLVEPYTGPAILMNRASGVFFHEIFGHRIEGHRQKSVEEGQTFTRMVGQSVLPSFISVIDDPTQARFGKEDLRGFYRYDEEGVPAQRVDLVTAGILNTFLMSRSPVAGFSKSNGHGRREPGTDVVSRQGNLMVQSTHAVPFTRLREMLIEECRNQEKPHGFLFEDITGGFTMTGRGGPQAFKVLPVVVYRVYADGRPDELVRGVDIVGTPLSCFAQITCTGDDPDVFNGTCGAESGWVPVSAISPSILVRQIEVEKRERSQQRLPILPSPIAADSPAPAAPISTKEFRP
jgi:predicted Zn-dependent protease